MKHLIFLLTVLLSLSATAADKSKTVTLNITGMTCDGCVSTVTKAIQKVSGVQSAKVRLDQKTATVIIASKAKVSPVQLIKAVSDAGYGASEQRATGNTKVKKMDSDSCGDGCCDDKAQTTSTVSSPKK